MQKDKRPSATLLFIFGGSGDLNYRKLTPALYNLFLDDQLPAQLEIVGLARTELTLSAYKKHLFDGIKKFSRRKKDLTTHWKAFPNTSLTYKWMLKMIRLMRKLEIW
jgi:glucose-6-phosphate 1-dehydrogenase